MQLAAKEASNYMTASLPSFKCRYNFSLFFCSPYSNVFLLFLLLSPLASFLFILKATATTTTTNTVRLPLLPPTRFLLTRLRHFILHHLFFFFFPKSDRMLCICLCSRYRVGEKRPQLSVLYLFHSLGEHRVFGSLGLVSSRRFRLHMQ